MATVRHLKSSISEEKTSKFFTGLVETITWKQIGGKNLSVSSKFDNPYLKSLITFVEGTVERSVIDIRCEHTSRLTPLHSPRHGSDLVLIHFGSEQKLRFVSRSSFAVTSLTLKDGDLIFVERTIGDTHQYELQATEKDCLNVFFFCAPKPTTTLLKRNLS